MSAAMVTDRNRTKRPNARSAPRSTNDLHDGSHLANWAGGLLTSKVGKAADTGCGVSDIVRAWDLHLRLAGAAGACGRCLDHRLFCCGG